MYKHPAFFKFFIDESSNTKLKIPPSFFQKIDQALPEQVYLRCRCNNTWKIKVSQIENDWYFSEGWAKFIADNAVQTGDLLVFQYFCHNAFNVKLFGPNATEKNLVGKFIHERVEEDHERLEEDQERVAEEEDEDDEETESEGNDYMLEREEQANTGGADTSENKRKRHRSSNAEWYGAEIFLAGLAQRPVNPYFVTTTKGKRKSDLYIPKDVAKYSNLDLTQDLVLIDPRGKEFPGKCKKWKDGRVVVTGGGWGMLCRQNFVAEEDKCICEFIQGRDGRLVLSVSFVRANGHLA